METKTSGNYHTNTAWFADVLGNEDVIFCRTSALECLQLFIGYGNERDIYVYAKSKGNYDNVNYFIVDSFDGIETVFVKGLLCTSVNQTINDMLDDFDNIDEQSLVEALSDYYYTHGNSFDGLMITPCNIRRFDAIKDWAMEYHEMG